MNQKNIKIIALVFGMATIAVIVVLNIRKSSISNHIVVGTVSSVVNKPNKAEDGYNGIQLTDKSGQKYTINATGYLNTPASPEEFGEICITVSQIKIGDKVEFNLPKSEDRQDTYYTCYKKSLTGYYLKLLN